jgi:hypothetical protein
MNDSYGWTSPNGGSRNITVRFNRNGLLCAPQEGT